MKRVKSAKDKAWDRERIVWRNRIDEAHEKERESLYQLSKAEVKIRSLEDWVERLMAFIDLPENEINRLINIMEREEQKGDELSNIYRPLFSDSLTVVPFTPKYRRT
jgi:uncharacterized protein YbaP (TraB family)